MSEPRVLQNLSRIEGQVRGIRKMVEDDRPCDEILTQIMAIKAALNRVTTDLVEDNMEACFQDLPPDEIKAKMAKSIKILCKM